MKDKVGIVTGCGRGIGYSITKKSLEKKENILIIGISRTETPQVKELRKNYPDNFLFKEIDMTDIKKINNFFKNLFEEKKNIEYVVCNAGIRSRLSMIKCSLDLYRSVLETNTISNINIAKQVIKNSLQRQSNCNILFISSIVGSRGFDELTTYAVSKSALEGFMRSVSVEYAKKGIQINCLAPGFIESSYFEDFKKNRKDLYDWTLSQTPMGRWGKCDEIADLALFLISEKNSYMTGSVIYSDGGWTSK